ncbi:MAG: peptidylprolyl isomerase, partial [Bacteroides sp.]
MRNNRAFSVRGVLLLLCVFASSGFIQAQNNVIDEVIWVVGDEAILKSDVEALRLQYLMEGQKLEGNPYCVIPEQIAVHKLFLNQAKLDSIEVSESAIIKQVDMYMSEYMKMFGSKEKMEELRNMSISQIRRELRDNLREGEIIKEVQAKLVGDITVNPAEVRRFFQDLPQDSIPYVPTQVEVQIITQIPKVSLAEVDDIKRRLREYTERVNAGEISFSTLARLYSEDRGSAMKGGEIGFTGRGSLAPEYANV